MTILQLAKELGVSKDKIKYLQRKLDPTLYYKDDSGKVILTDDAVKVIREQLGKSTQEETGEKPGNSPEKNPLFQALIDQLKEKDKQIDQLQHLLAMAAAEKTELLKQLPPPAEEKKPSFFARLLGI